MKKTVSGPNLSTKYIYIEFWLVEAVYFHPHLIDCIPREIGATDTSRVDHLMLYFVYNIEHPWIVEVLRYNAVTSTMNLS